MSKLYEAVLPASGWSEKFTFSPAVRAGNLLFISGMNRSGLRRPHHRRERHRAADGVHLRKWPRCLRRRARISPTSSRRPSTTPMIGTTGKSAVVRRKVFGGPPYPAATGVRVAGLVRAGALIEIKALAVLADS